MKRSLEAFGAGLLVALVATLVFERRARSRRGAREEEGHRQPGLRFDPEQIAEEMKDDFVPGKTNTGEPAAASVDLNSCSSEDLSELGIEQEWVERVIENRPYRNKLDLLSRMVLPEDEFQKISERVSVSRPDEGVKIA